MMGEIAATTVDQLAHGTAAKVLGARHLDELLDEEHLDTFLLCSSITSVWGSRDHVAYATCHAYLDALAEQRRARGATATSIAWGPLGTDDPETPGSQRRDGLADMAPARALEVLDRALADGETFMTVADVDWERFAALFASTRRSSPLLWEIPEARAALRGPEPGAVAAQLDPGLTERLAEASEPDQRRMVLELVRGHAAAALGHQSLETVGPDSGFQELGFDSLLAVDLRNRLSTATGLSLPPAVVFEHPSPADLAEYLRTAILHQAGPATVRTG